MKFQGFHNSFYLQTTLDIYSVLKIATFHKLSLTVFVIYICLNL